MDNDSLVPVDVVNVLVSDNHFLVILREKEGERRLIPISVGIFEANGIIMALEGMKTRRPFTYDIIRDILIGSDLSVEKLVIHKLEDNIFHGTLTISHNGSTKDYDIRPSDGIALSVRFNSPILVHTQVITKLVEEQGAGDAFSHIEKMEAYGDIDETDEEVDIDSYETDEEEITPLYEGAYKDQLIKNEINYLNQKMNRAVEDERYEDAALLRDRIEELEKKLNL